MAEQRPTLREDAAMQMVDLREKVVSELMRRLERPSDTVKLTRDEERQLFWRRVKSPEDEASLRVEGLSDEDVSRAVYPHRWELAEQYGLMKGSLTKFAEWANGLAEGGPPMEDVTTRMDVGTEEYGGD